MAKAKRADRLQSFDSDFLGKYAQFLHFFCFLHCIHLPIFTNIHVKTGKTQGGPSRFPLLTTCSLSSFWINFNAEMGIFRKIFFVIWLYLPGSTGLVSCKVSTVPVPLRLRPPKIFSFHAGPSRPWILVAFLLFSVRIIRRAVTRPPPGIPPDFPAAFGERLHRPGTCSPKARSGFFCCLIIHHNHEQVYIYERK